VSLHRALVVAALSAALIALGAPAALAAGTATASPSCVTAGTPTNVTATGTGLPHNRTLLVQVEDNPDDPFGFPMYWTTVNSDSQGRASLTLNFGWITSYVTFRDLFATRSTRRRW